MKKICLSMLLLTTIVSCTQTDYEVELEVEDLSGKSLSITRATTLQDIDSLALRDSVYEEFFVSYQDAWTYAAMHSNEEKVLDAIVPMGDDVDTLMYLIQYENGWDIIAADKRGPLVVAMSESGRFASNDTLPGFQTYLEVQKLYLKSMRYVTDNNSASDAYLFWSMVTPQNSPKSRVTGSGYWEMYDSESETTTAESGHMLQTKWGQHYPWDVFVPYNTESSGERCAVGCVPVAGAQMLYYLHNEIGLPQNMYTSGGCTGNNNSYSYSFSNPTATAWENMALTQYDNNTSRTNQAALLMAYVGCHIDTEYGTSSGAKTEDLVSLFSSLGISSTYEDYNSSTAWNSLRNDMPVIVDAYLENDKILGIINNYKGGHAWVMDGWKTVTTRTTCYYGWVDSTWQDFKPMEPLAPAIVIPDDMIKYRDFKTETRTYVSKSVLMNWGWNGASDNIYCTLDGAWSPYTDTNFQYKRRMLHGFKAK